jgi:ABC-2 type transport system permease protein
MKDFRVLIAHSLKRVRTLVLVMSFVLAVFQVFIIVIARTIEESNIFEQMLAIIPPFIRQMMGPSFSSVMTFRGMVSLGYFHLAIMSSLIGLAIAIATMPTSEVEIGFMDLILARPVTRHRIITRTIVILIACEGFVLAMMMAGTWIGLSALAPKRASLPGADLIFSLAANLGLLALSWGGIAMAIGAASRRRAVAGSITGFLALVTFLLDYITRAWEPAEAVAWLSPFRYYDPLNMVTGQPIQPRNLLVLAAIAITGFAVAYLVFSRRDI